ncbi:MAG: Xre family transcriptional regulator with cupin sensor [Rhodobacteraceae bacterium HLUCCA08]|nr:MAG: Xre family transcriptional regulator with cupin sensor [Rhodobacteraceae bacterium HLUCCA08]
MENADSILSLLPERLRKARQARGLSLDAVARLSGVSRSMVSQIERGNSSPTVSTLWNLTRALQVDFAGLLDDQPPRPVEVLRAQDVPTIENHGTGCAIRILSPPEDAGTHEVYDLRFAENGRLASAPHGHGTQENLTVIEGAIIVTSGEGRERVEAGETARYAADVPHCLQAEGAARAFLVVKGG